MITKPLMTTFYKKNIIKIMIYNLSYLNFKQYKFIFGY